MRIALPAKGRLREDCRSLLGQAGFAVDGSAARMTVEGIEMIEMRPRDAAVALAAGQLDAAFLATDIVAEHELTDLPATPLGLARCDLVVAARQNDGPTEVSDMDGAVVATHLPRTTRRYFARHDVDVRVLEMGGSLEGVCAAGIADAIVDLRQTGASLRANQLRVLDVITGCQALFVRRDPAAFDTLRLRIEAILSARRQRYVMLHLPPARLDSLQHIVAGLAAPTVLPLAGRPDLRAVHLVIDATEFWRTLPELRAIGATGIVSTRPEAVLP